MKIAMTNGHSNTGTICGILLFVMAGAAVSSIYLEWPPASHKILSGGILGELTGLAFLASKRGASIGACTGGTTGAAILLAGFLIIRSACYVGPPAGPPFFLFLGSSFGAPGRGQYRECC